MSAAHVLEKDSLLRGIARGAGRAISVLFAVTLVAAIVVPRLIGAVPLTVLTGSMQPGIKPGALIVSQKVDPADVHTGDIITYQAKSNDPMLITHRVKSIAYGTSGIDHFTLRGDANGVDDEPVKPQQVMGRYVYQLPYLGYAANAIPETVKPFLLQAIGTLLLLSAAVQFVVSTIKKRRAPSVARPATQEGRVDASR